MRPFSQFATVHLLTLRHFPTCRWVSPNSSRLQRMCSPRDCGSKSKAFRFRHLSETRRNGKKATPPCPCGYLGHPNAQCHCSPERIARYRGRLSGPLLDRIDLHVEVPALSESDLVQAPQGEPTRAVLTRVRAARAVQERRQGLANARIAGSAIDRLCVPDETGRRLLRQAAARLSLSARACHRVLRVARTIADLAGGEALAATHIAEALQFRPVRHEGRHFLSPF